jgi:hypothetical protein
LNAIHSGGSFSPSSGTALPDTPISVTFTPNPLDAIYDVDISVTDPVTGVTGDGDLLIVTPFYIPPSMPL